MIEKNIYIGFLAMGMILILISVKTYTLLILFIGLGVFIQGIYGIIKK